MKQTILIGLAAGIASTLIGAAWQIATRHGVTTTLSPPELALFRYGIPALMLLPLTLRHGLLLRGRPLWQSVLLIAGGGLPFGLLVVSGAQWAPVAHMSVLLAGTMPLLAALLWACHSGEAIAARRIAGFVLLAAGVALSVTSVSSQAILQIESKALLGDALFLAASLCWAGYTLALRKLQLDAWHAAALVNTWSLMLLLPVLAVTGLPRLAAAPLADVALQAAMQGVVAGLLGLWTYGVAVNRLGTGNAALFAAPVPVIAALGGAALLGESLTVAVMIAAALVAAGVALASNYNAQVRKPTKMSSRWGS